LSNFMLILVKTGRILDKNSAKTLIFENPLFNILTQYSNINVK